MKNIAIVLGSFHKKEMEIMLAQARITAKENELNITDEIWVPGSMEKPIIAKKLAQRKDIDGIVILGIIEKGETKHGLVMAQTVIQSLLNIQLEYMKPMGMGILGPEIEPAQIPARLEPYADKAVSAVALMIQIV